MTKLKTVILVVWFNKADAACSPGLNRKEAETAVSKWICGVFNR